MGEAVDRLVVRLAAADAKAKPDPNASKPDPSKPDPNAPKPDPKDDPKPGDAVSIPHPTKPGKRLHGKVHAVVDVAGKPHAVIKSPDHPTPVVAPQPSTAPADATHVTKKESGVPPVGDDPAIERKPKHASLDPTAALAAKIEDAIALAFNPDQPRDEYGRWSASGGTPLAPHALNRGHVFEHGGKRYVAVSKAKPVRNEVVNSIGAKVPGEVIAHELGVNLIRKDGTRSLVYRKLAVPAHTMVHLAPHYAEKRLGWMKILGQQPPSPHHAPHEVGSSADARRAQVLAFRAGRAATSH